MMKRPSLSFINKKTIKWNFSKLNMKKKLVELKENLRSGLMSYAEK